MGRITKGKSEHGTLVMGAYSTKWREKDAKLATDFAERFAARLRTLLSKKVVVTVGKPTESVTSSWCLPPKGRTATVYPDAMEVTVEVRHQEWALPIEAKVTASIGFHEDLGGGPKVTANIYGDEFIGVNAAAEVMASACRQMRSVLGGSQKRGTFPASPSHGVRERSGKGAGR